MWIYAYHKGDKCKLIKRQPVTLAKINDISHKGNPNGKQHMKRCLILVTRVREIQITL